MFSLVVKCVSKYSRKRSQGRCSTSPWDELFVSCGVMHWLRARAHMTHPNLKHHPSNVVGSQFFEGMSFRVGVHWEGENAKNNSFKSWT